MFKLNALTKSVALTIVGAATLTNAALAQSSNCSAIDRQQIRIENEMTNLLFDYPGAAIVMGACTAIGASSYDGSGSIEQASVAFLGCAGVGCMFAGFDNCTSVTVKVFELGLRLEQVESQRNRFCRRRY